MYQGFAAQMLTAQIGFAIGYDQLETASPPPSLMADPDTELVAKTALVCFPVMLLGDSGPLIPFGRYDLVFESRQTSPTGAETAVRAAMVSRNGGGTIPLSAQQLDALAQDPDVEIF